MSVTILDCLGIHEYEIERIADRCIEALDEYEINIDFENEVIEDLKEIGDWDDIGNSIIMAMLSTTAGIIKREKNIETDYYVNGLDSHLYINGEEYYGK